MSEQFTTIHYELPAPGVARVVMDRYAVRNAQNVLMSCELDSAFELAIRDDSVKVIILAGADPHFSAGHDLSGYDGTGLGEDQPPRSGWAGFAQPAAEGRYSREQEIYLQNTRRWRNLSKPTIAAVQGKCIAGGLMLAWMCDLIIASDDASFLDPAVAMGVCGVEWFVHPWELGPRKAKEFLFTSDYWTAQDAMQLGMVNRVVPRSELQAYTLDLAKRIATKPMFGLQMAKQAVNQAVDTMGQQSTIDQAFSIHQLCHANNKMKFGSIIDPGGLSPLIKRSVHRVA